MVTAGWRVADPQADQGAGATSSTPAQFWQIHRSTLVNVNAIVGVVRDFRGHLQVKLQAADETLPVAESYTHLFRQM